MGFIYFFLFEINPHGHCFLPINVDYQHPAGGTRWKNKTLAMLAHTSCRHHLFPFFIHATNGGLQQEKAHWMHGDLMKCSHSALLS